MSKFAFRCPVCDSGVHVSDSGRRALCEGCGSDAAMASGVVHFIRSEERRLEQAYYDDVYIESTSSDLIDLHAEWRSLYYPMNRRVLTLVGDIEGRVVVLLGNGTSSKELAFLEQDPALLVVSDLSPAAIARLRDQWLPDGRPNVVFAAIDALDLPFPDGSVDLLYGCAFVHHLPDVDAFLTEAVRVLAPGGRCVFADSAYAPLWQAAKSTLLRPLMHYYHRILEPSPEDLRFTLEGGFREERLARRILELGCQPWFERSGFVHYFVTRASERLPPQRIWRALVLHDGFLAALISFDERIARFEVVQRNLIRLVWGLDKPRSAATPEASKSSPTQQQPPVARSPRTGADDAFSARTSA